MKYILAVLVGLMTVALTNTVSANPSDAGDSILVGQVAVKQATPDAPRHLVSTPSVAVSAPLMDASQAQTKIDSPIVAPAPAAPVVSSETVQHRRTYHRPKKKQSFFDKMMEMERKKNAWLKRTFLGM